MPEPHPTHHQRIALGLAAWDRDDYPTALAAFDEVLEEHPGFPDVHNKRGLCLAMLGRLTDALSSFERAVELAPTYAEAHLNRGIILNELGRHDEAQAAFDESSRLDLRDGNAYPSQVGNQIAITHAKLGDLYLVADRPAQAAREYAAALEVRPGFVDIRTKLAEALMETGDAEAALRELEAVLAVNEDFTGARLRLGVVLQRLGRTDEAIFQWRRCLLEDPGDMRPRAYLASAGIRNPSPGG